LDVEDRWLYGWGLGYAAVRSGTLIPPLSLVTNVSETRDPLAVFETEGIESPEPPPGATPEQSTE